MTTPTASRLTISTARRIQAEDITGATYWRALDGEVVVDRGHTSARNPGWDMDALLSALESGFRVELRTGSIDGTLRHVFQGVDPGVRAAI